MTQRCKTCRWFDPAATFATDDEDVAICAWPADRLPFSLRVGNRERMMVTAQDGAGCAGWEGERPAPRETTDEEKADEKYYAQMMS